MIHESSPESYVTHSEFSQFRHTTENTLDRIERKIDGSTERQRTQWGVLAAWAGVLVSLGVLAYKPISDRVENVETISAAAVVDRFTGAEGAELRERIVRLETLNGLGVGGND